MTSVGSSPPRSPVRTPRKRMTPCHYCGSPIDTAEWYPIVTTTDEGGKVELYPFCDNRCRDTWLAKTPNR